MARKHSVIIDGLDLIGVSVDGIDLIFDIEPDHFEEYAIDVVIDFVTRRFESIIKEHEEDDIDDRLLELITDNIKESILKMVEDRIIFVNSNERYDLCSRLN